MTNRFRLGLTTAAVVFAALIATAAQAHSATGGYPYWNYDGPGSNPATYTWTNAQGYGFSRYGYAFRNCTDYVAWKLSTTNHFGDYRGLGNAVSWAGAARARGYRVNHVPGLGSVAWWGAEKFHGFGHVAWVVSVGVGSVEIAEYNHAGNGRFDLRRIRPGMVDSYIHFKDLPAEIPRAHAVLRPAPG